MGSKTWHGIGIINTHYDDPANWVPGGVPTTGDTAFFTANGANTSVDLAANGLSVDGWNFTSGGYTVSVSGSVFFGGVGVQVSAGSAAISVASTGTLTFQANSDGGSAQYITVSGAVINFSGTGLNGDGKFSMGGLQGAGDVFLPDGAQLTLGSNGLSGVFSGNMLGGPGTSLVKVGLGTETLSGNNVLSHITVLDGKLDLASIGGDGGADITLGATPATLQIENAALGFGGHFNSHLLFQGTGPVVVDLPGLPFSPATLLTYDKIHSTLGVDNGFEVVFFNYWSSDGTDYVALDGQGGDTKIERAIIESRPNKHVDANHHPPGQPSLINGPLCIDVRGANCTVNAPGGNYTFICEGPGSIWYARPGDDFVYESLKASPPNHPDTITHFKQAQGASHAQGVTRAQGAKIDLFDLHFFVPGHHHLVFIGAQTFAQYHHHHSKVFGMVRDAGGIVEVNVNHNLAPDFAVKVPGVQLHVGDLIL